MSKYALVVSSLALFSVSCGKSQFAGSSDQNYKAAKDNGAASAELQPSDAKLSWCEDWQLKCDQTEKFPADTAHFAGTMFMALGKTSSKLAFSSADLNAQPVKDAVKLLNASKTLEDINGYLQKLGIQTLVIEKGGIRKTGSKGSAKHVNIEWGLAPETSIQFSSPTSVELVGFSMGSYKGDQVQLGGAALVNSRVSMKGPDFLVSDLHPYFFAETDTDTDTDEPKVQVEKTPAEKTADLGNMVRASQALYPYVLNGVNQIVLDQAFLATLETELPKVVKKLPPQASQAFKATRSIRIGENKVPLAIDFAGPQSFSFQDNCSDGMKIALSLQQKASISSITPLQTGEGVRIMFQGIAVDLTNVPIINSLKLELQQIDVTPTGIRIYNVPLIGSYNLQFADLFKQPSAEESSAETTCPAA
ncbi:MAG: hypothetical protein ACOVS5_04400 [Oligoflexus sp.]|jgi:hypothetical protein